MIPRYPVYVISKGRADACLTARFLVKDGVPFRLIVEPQEQAWYEKHFGKSVQTLPFSNLGLGSIPARNWCWEHSKSLGARRHWILDDNIRQVRRLFKTERIPCASGPALCAVEDFIDRYENIAIGGLNYTMFWIEPSLPPFYLNQHVYSCLLILNALPHRWRGRYNEDADLCLQVLSAGLCTVLVNAFMIDKMGTMAMKGGNTDELYKGDGRLKMSRALQRKWPGVVDTARRFHRAQHVVKGNWRGFDTPLKRIEGLDIPVGRNEYGLSLKAVKTVRSPQMRKLLKNTGRA